MVVEIQKEVTSQLANKEVMNALIATTFNGFSEVMVKQAITEGMMRGFNFKNFLQKDVYAIKYGNGYSLITSIDYARKLGMSGGVVGRSAPTWETDEDGKILSCTVTVKKASEKHVGEFTETVYFNEYTTGKNLWITKPRTMIAKVAEMHALRMACPEELAKAYVEEELEKEVAKPEISEEDIIAYTEKLESAKNIEELGKFFIALPAQIKVALKDKKDELKIKLKSNADNLL